MTTFHRWFFTVYGHPMDRGEYSRLLRQLSPSRKPELVVAGGFAIGLALLTGSAHADTKTDLATCKMESMRVSDALSLAYVRNCMDAKKYDFTPIPEGCVVPGQAIGTTGGYMDKRLAVERTTYDCFHARQ